MKNLLSKSLMFGLLAGVLSATAQAAEQPKNYGGVVFPDVQDSYLKEVPRYEFEDAIRIGVGIHKDTTRQILGNPHFKEFSSKEWNYVLNIREPYTRNYFQCQLQLHFDKENNAESVLWNTPKCLDFVSSDVDTPEPPPEPKPRTFSLSSDLLFDFDSSELKSSSSSEIKGLFEQVAANYSRTTKIRVIGHTDRLGAEAYNQKLSQERAEAVKAAMVASGFDSTVISAVGYGEQKPISDGCFNLSTSQTKICLAPDRRVDIQVFGELK